MLDWFSQHPWTAWFALALGLGAAEMFTLELTLLMLAGGALAGGIVALIAPGLVIVQVVVALVAAVALLGLLRPRVLERFGRGGGYRSSNDRLVGATARADTQIDADSGTLTIEGITWEARLVTEGTVAKGQRVEVHSVDGATLMVYPLDLGWPAAAELDALPNQTPANHPQRSVDAPPTNPAAGTAQQSAPQSTPERPDQRRP